MRDNLYRFHGRVKPVRRSVLNDAPTRVDDDAAGVAVLRLYDPIDSWGGDWGVSAKEFLAALDDIEEPEIRLHINSPGGEVFEAIAIMNGLRRHPARVTTVVDGIAASCASFVAVSADQTVAGRNSELMIHDAWGLCMGNAADMRKLADDLDRVSDNIASVYSGKAGGDVAGWRAAMVEETWYSADEAAAAGLVDVVEGADDVPPSDAFDLSVFKHQGRSDATAPPPIPVLAGRDARYDMRHRLNSRRVAVGV